jgi:hypothetical protein
LRARSGRNAIGPFFVEKSANFLFDGQLVTALLSRAHFYEPEGSGSPWAFTAPL